MTTAERRHWRRVGVFVVNFEHISHLVLVFLLLTLMYLQAGLFFFTCKKRHCERKFGPPGTHTIPF